MKLPPAALTAPSLCPRCDAPALYEDHCTSCGLQLGKCGACQGVAGPFDRYCGFCGHDLAAGEARSPVWRLWLLVAMIPMVAVLVVMATLFGGPAATRVGSLVFRPQPTATGTPAATSGVKTLRSQNLHLRYSIPNDWSGFDYSLSTATPLPEVVVARIQVDGTKFGDTRGDILAANPTGALLTLGAPGAAPAGVDPADPSSVLGADIGRLTSTPPAGSQIEVFRPATTTTVNGRTGKEVVFKVTRGTKVYFFERAYLLGPAGLFKIDALVPQPDWESGDAAKIEAVFQSVALTG